MILWVHHRVRDYDTWKPLFDEHQALREQHEGRGHKLFRSLDDPNDLIVAVEFPSEDAARAFAADPSLREVMTRAGVEGTPTMVFGDKVEAISYTAVPA